MLYSLLKPWIFLLDPELSHTLAFSTLKMMHKLRAFSPPQHRDENAVRCFGIDFPNSIGLAAGLDKNGECIPAWEAFGFGFIEVGTVTPKPQPGNPKPRLFRLKKNQAIINRMGFNNHGVDYLIEQLKKCKVDCPIGVNIGKNKDTPLLQASEDYLSCFKKVSPFADYVTINLSSPNTPGLKSLQHGEMLKNILSPLKDAQLKLTRKVPIMVKISPDVTEEELGLIIDELLSMEIEGVIATNTTIKRENLVQEKNNAQEGGLSGRPLFKQSTAIVKAIYQQAGEKLPIIAVGGIFTKENVKEKFAAGAELVQLYSGLIYHGPAILNQLL